MVVSKDNKRRRKETDTPPTSSSAAAAAATLAVESSPEMPKRTKVQAQRKFAQGQSAPNAGGAFSIAAAVAPGSSSSGPSTSTDSQQPPIEILPNQRPKPQDFLTFLCFRSFQGKPKANDTVPPSSDAVNNNTNKKNSSSSNKKKRGRPAKKSGAEQLQKQQQQQPEQPMPEADKTASDKIEAAKSPTPSPAPPPSAAPLLLAGAVRKRAEIVAEGNRRGGRRVEALKRRSNRGGTKKDDQLEEQEQSSQQQDNDDEDPVEEEDDEDEFFSAHDASSRNGGAADETLSKSEAMPTRRGRGKKSAGATADSPAAVQEHSAGKEKEKGPVKRLRQPRESPIFIPSPESSGRMTRQRAFFEPVKVPPKLDPDPEDEKVEEEELKQKEPKLDQEQKQKSTPEPKPQPPQIVKEKTNSSIYAKDAAKLENGVTTATSTAAADPQKSLNVFDFSSDDEQPLSKAIKLKKGGKKGAAGSGAAATLPANARGRKSAGGSAKKQQQQREDDKEKEKSKATAAPVPVSTPTPSKSEESSKAKRGKALKKKAVDNYADEEEEEAEHEPELSPPSPKKPTGNTNHNARPARRQAAQPKVQQRSPSPSPQRSQRPSRKTKEAAAIYMGIIGHKLQMADDDDDDLSLDSFPDIPNVKQMEKMEKEIKKNAAGKASNADLKKTSMKPAAALATTTTAKDVAGGSEVAGAGRSSVAAAAAVEQPSETSATAVAATSPPTPPPPPAHAPRRGRPPKQAKGAGGSVGAAAAIVKPQIEGMLVKKGALALAKAKSEQQQKNQQLQQLQQQQQQQQKVDSDAEEDFLINEELNETKRKLEKSFSDSDDEPLAIKVPIGGSTPAAAAAATITAKAAASSSSKTETPATTPAPTTTTTTAAGTTAATAVAATVAPPSTTTATTFAATTAAAAIAGTLKPPQLNVAMPITPLTMLPLTTKPSPFSISPPSYASAAATLKAMEKKSPVPTSKILNVPATYALPGASSAVSSGLGVGTVGFGKSTSYLPQASPHYQSPYVRPPTFCAAAGAAAAIGNKTPHPQQQQQQQQLLATTSQTTSPLKYQTAPTIYPPPIEAYQCPKINPNFLTPKYDRASILPRVNNNNNSVTISNTSSNNFTSPIISRPTLSSLTTPTTTAAAAAAAALKTTATVSQSLNLSITSSSSQAVASTSAAAAAAAAAASAAAAQQQQQQQQQLQQQQQQLNQPHPQQQSPTALTMTPTTSTNNNSDPLKDEIGSILAQATLMPSKEESGKIFGIASVSLAQSSGPDNTKCTLGKCGSIHKPVLGPVVPTEAYFGDQLSGKERRKAKVNMTHEQIQKWLIECSSNPDEIQDDLDDEYDDSLRPQQSQTPPGPTRDDKESTSFSSSSKNTRGELGKSESAWSAKGPSLKATPVLVSTAAAATAAAAAAAANRRDVDTESDTMDFDKCVTPVNLTQKKDADATGVNDRRSKPKSGAKASASATVAATAAGNHNKRGATAANKRLAAATATKLSTPTNSSSNTPTSATATTTTMTTTTTTPAKRTPIYQSPSKSKAQTQLDNKKQQLLQQQQKMPAKTSVYAFGKDEDTTTAAATAAVVKATTATVAAGNKTTATNRRRNAEVETTTTTTAATPPPALSERSPTKKRAAATAAATAVQLTLSPTDKLEKPKAAAAAARKKQQQQQKEQLQKEQQHKDEKEQQLKKIASAEAAAADAAAGGGDSDAEGATFYIPLRQGASSGDGGIQGVAVKLGREGPDGPNQKVVMQATLVTKAQMDTNSNKPMPDNELVKTLLNAANTNSEPTTPGGNNSIKASTSAAAAATATTSGAAAGATTSGSLVRVNSNSSLFSGSAKSRTAAASVAAANALAKKYKDDTPIKMANNTAFPRHDDPTQMVEAPIFKPTEKEFADPIEFIERITPIAARFGICKIIPPASFKPECRISDEMRFTAYNQYVHKMLHRWGPSAKELSAIKKYLATQSIVMNHAPWIGGMEVDLPRLYHTVQELGGLKEVIEKKKWARVAEEMCIPKLAQDRVTKLDDIYCKYLLPYDTLSPAERQKLFDEVEADWAKREARARRNADRFVNSTESVSNVEDDVSTDEDDESEEELDGVSMECIVKGRSMPLSQFYRIARNTMALWFKSTDPTVNEVEAEFWRHVAVRDSHVCVHSGSIDSSGWGYGFPSPGPKGKGSNYARHPWNLKVLTNNSGSVLRSLGPVMGVTVPTLHVGMLFSACCWYRDPHGLSWIEYLHTGASKLWYGIPDDQSANFRSALTSLIPTHCQNKTIWLPCDTVMVPPHMLTDRGVSLCRIEQKPGEFIVVFPRAYTSSLATGYVVSESVYFATNSWLDLAKDDFRDIHESCEPAMFSLEQLLFALGYDQRVNSDTLHQMLPMLNDVCEKESAAREQLRAAGVTTSEKVQAEKGQKTKKQQQPPHKSIDSECDLCRANLYISMVRTDDGNIYCLQHALKNINSGNVQPKMCKLVYAYNVDDVQQLIRQLQDKINQIHHKAAVKKK